jgi:hypothetical protein
MVELRRTLGRVLLVAAPLCALALQPGMANATIQEQTPEFAINNKTLGLAPAGFVMWGSLRLQTPQPELEISCVNLGFGQVNNEGPPLVGHGQILSWVAQGHEPPGSPAPDACSFKKTGVEGEPEAWMTDEPDEPGLDTSSRVPLTVPWNLQLVCSEEEFERHVLVRIGVPTGAAAHLPSCKTDQERAAEIEAEEKERTGCYATRVPEGCIKADFVVPALGLEMVFEGTQEPVLFNGFTNGLHPSVWEFTSPTSHSPPATLGQLRLKNAYTTAALMLGRLKMVGWGLQLIAVK